MGLPVVAAGVHGLRAVPEAAPGHRLGMAEVGCKLTVGGRLKGPGMHWRFENGIGVALLRGVLRSRREIAA